LLLSVERKFRNNNAVIKSNKIKMLDNYSDYRKLLSTQDHSKSKYKDNKSQRGQHKQSQVDSRARKTAK